MLDWKITLLQIRTFVKYHLLGLKFMPKIIFAIPSDGSEQDVSILVESIREFGGQFSKNEIWFSFLSLVRKLLQSGQQN